MKRTLYLKLVPVKLIAKKWNIHGGTIVNTSTLVMEKPTLILTDACVMVRCNSKGDINWEHTAIYKMEDLIGKNVKFL
jgi:hypothetical protein